MAELWWLVDVNLLLGCRAEAEADGSNLVFDQSNFGSAGGSWWRASASSPSPASDQLYILSSDQGYSTWDNIFFFIFLLFIINLLLHPADI